MLKSLGKVTVFSVLMLTLCTGLFLIAVWTVDDAVNYVPSLQIGTLDTAKVSARSFEVFDLETGTEITSKEKDTVLPIASITKLVTASVFYTTAKLTATTSIQWSDVNTDGDAGKLHVGEVYSNRELLYPLLLESSNDSAVTMLRVEPQLVTLMQEYVNDLGLSHTQFFDTSGLSDKSVSTADELSQLSMELFETNAHIFDITRLRQFIGTHTGWLNNNPLFMQDGYRGGKHGFTYEANRTAVAFFDEALEGGQVRTIGYVLLGSDDLVDDMEILRAQVQKNVRFK